MNILKALNEGRRSNRAIKREDWKDDVFISLAVNGTLVFYGEEKFEEGHVFELEDILSDDWCLSDFKFYPTTLPLDGQDIHDRIEELRKIPEITFTGEDVERVQFVGLDMEKEDPKHEIEEDSQEEPTSEFKEAMSGLPSKEDIAKKLGLPVELIKNIKRRDDE